MSDSNTDATEYELKRQQQQHRLSPPTAAAAAEGGIGRASSLEGRSANIEEQQPVMRSIAINPLTQHRRTLHFEPPLRRVEPGGTTGLAKLRGISEPALLQTSVSKPLPKEALRIRSKSESALVRKWHVEHATLPSRPDDLPPLRTTRTVEHEPAHVISNRISDCLQSRSIKTKFSKSHDNIAKCRNVDFCKFTIRLYAAEEGGVLVEVQRLCGDAVSFMKDCRAVLNAAEGTKDEEKVGDDTPMYLRLPVSQMMFVKEVTLPPITPEEQADAVNVTAELLSSHQSDSNMLGMEALAIQTDPLKTMKSTAILASRRILCPSDPGNGAFNMHNYVMSLLIYNEADEDTEDDPSVPEETAMEDHSIKLRNLAMSALSNSLTLLSEEKLLLSCITSSQEWYTSVLIPKLLQDLSTAEQHPHDACYASRCLSTLAEASCDFSSKMRDVGGEDALKSAEEVGVREFALLARDAGSCHKILCSV